MDVHVGIPEEHVSAHVLNAMLEATTRVNEKLIKSGQAPSFDDAIASGVVWAPEPPGQESFDHIGKVAKRGWGDCDDLAPAHAATLRVTGEDPGARAIAVKVAPHRWHAVTERSSGQLEDPSRTAGMRVRDRSNGIPAAVVAPMNRAASVVGGVDGCRPFVAVGRDKVTGKWVGRTDVPLSCDTPGHVIAVTQRAATPASALAGSMAGACIVGACSRMVAGRHVDKLWAVSGLLRGKSPRAMASVVGVQTTKDAVRTLAELCPAILTELQAHRAAVEGGRSAGRPFA